MAGVIIPVINVQHRTWRPHWASVGLGPGEGVHQQGIAVASDGRTASSPTRRRQHNSGVGGAGGAPTLSAPVEASPPALAAVATAEACCRCGHWWRRRAAPAGTSVSAAVPLLCLPGKASTVDVDGVESRSKWLSRDLLGGTEKTGYACADGK
jgi:hypothetical protein